MVLTESFDAVPDEVVVRTFPSMDAAWEFVLVVLAMGQTCSIQPSETGYALVVEEDSRELIEEELALYEQEQALVREPSVIPIFSSGLELALAWVLLLVFVFSRQLKDVELTERFLNSSQRVLADGEFYRVLTALFLHADFEHLLGNAVFGVIFAVFVSNTFGPWKGWVLTILSGALGNLLNAWIHYPEIFRSLGASTAVFGSLGLLVGSGLFRAWLQRSYRKGLQVFAPLFAGLMIFTVSGIGGPGTDTLAHLTGMFFGVLLGFCFAEKGPQGAK